MAVKLAGVKPGDKFFCSDMIFDATVDPVVYEAARQYLSIRSMHMAHGPGGIGEGFWALLIKVVVVVYLYGTPGNIKAVCDKHGAVIIENAEASFCTSALFSRGVGLSSISAGDFV